MSEKAVTIRRSTLSAALRGDKVNGDDLSAGVLDQVAVADISDVTMQAPTAYDPGWVDLAGVGVRLRFSPRQEDNFRQFLTALATARSGEDPADTGVPGLDFIALDVETANSDFGSICQVGLVRYVDGRESGSRAWLCRPPARLEEFLPANIAVHGITAAKVADQPRIGEIIDEIRDFLDGQPFVAHNAQFDATALRRAAVASEREIPSMDFGCSLTLARHQELPVANNKLPTLAEFFGVELTSHHDALADARACGEITVSLARRQGFSGSLMELLHSGGFTLGEITAERVIPVQRDRSGAGRALQAGGDSAARVVGGAGTDFRDRKQTSAETGTGPATSERRRGPAPWQSVSTPEDIPEPNAAADPNHPLHGQNVTLTGDFSPYDKGRLWAGIAEHGGQVAKNVTRKTTLLVTGAWATKTSKEKRAEELQEKGQEIQVWTAEQLYDALDLNEQPPF
ncbi:MAG TPA: exonuclease domain-containing protein [Corynebacterium sp.]|nr:exonuclease domain-containing protein [Corynebacterium sp.]